MRLGGMSALTRRDEKQKLAIMIDDRKPPLSFFFDEGTLNIGDCR